MNGKASIWKKLFFKFLAVTLTQHLVTKCPIPEPTTLLRFIPFFCNFWRPKSIVSSRLTPSITATFYLNLPAIQWLNDINPSPKTPTFSTGVPIPKFSLILLIDQTSHYPTNATNPNELTNSYPYAKPSTLPWSATTNNSIQFLTSLVTISTKVTHNKSHLSHIHTMSSVRKI